MENTIFEPDYQFYKYKLQKRKRPYFGLGVQ